MATVSLFKTIRFSGLLLFGGTFLTVPGFTAMTIATQPAANEAHAASARLKVMTYNLKFASETSAHPWSQRRPLIKSMISHQDPDIIGTQEGLSGQLGDIAADLPEYAWVGQGREGKQRGEFSAIFYKKSRLQVLDQGNFWLSSTPEIAGSRSWGNYIPRMATWALFKDRQTGERFYQYNTHFDHLMPFARSYSADLLKQRIAGRAFNAPVVLTGDFNCGQGSSVHEMLAAPMQGASPLMDTWDHAQAREGLAVSTYHGWNGPSNGDRRIDWILTTPDFKCDRSSVLTDQVNGQWPSDHFPVVSELQMPPAATSEAHQFASAVTAYVSK